MTLTAEFDNRSEIFDKHDITRKKAMLYHIIDRIDVWRGRVEITYKIRLDAFVGTQDESANFENNTEKLDLEQEKCYTASKEASGAKPLQIYQKREAVFAIPSGRQTSKERKYIAVK